MDEELAQIKKLEMLTLRHQELDVMIDSMNSEKFKDEFTLHKLKKEKLSLRDEIAKLSDAIYPDIIA